MTCHAAYMYCCQSLYMTCDASSTYLYRLTKNENAVEASHVTTQGNFQPSNNAQFVCPITGQELNGRFRFSVLRNTGDVVSERAIKQVYVVLCVYYVVQVSRGNWWFVSTKVHGCIQIVWHAFPANMRSSQWRFQTSHQHVFVTYNGCTTIRGNIHFCRYLWQLRSM